MLGGIAKATPPQNGPIFDNIVQPGLANLGWSYALRIAIVGQGAQKGEGAGYVVICDDKRWIVGHLIIDVVSDLAQLFHDLFVVPLLKRPSYVDANNFFLIRQHKLFLHNRVVATLLSPISTWHLFY